MLGARYDDYSDFGGTFNPRVGLSWDIIDKSKLRLPYGTAFRAPDFRSLYIRNNPVVEGNPDLTKLTAILMVTSTVAILLACSGFIVFDLFRQRQALVDDLTTLVSSWLNIFWMGINYGEKDVEPAGSRR